MTPKPAKPLAPPEPAMDLGDYHRVTVVRTDDVDGHTYRRGERPTVNTATLNALKARGMVDADSVQPAA